MKKYILYSVLLFVMSVFSINAQSIDYENKSKDFTFVDREVYSQIVLWISENEKATRDNRSYTKDLQTYLNEHLPNKDKVDQFISDFNYKKQKQDSRVIDFSDNDECWCAVLVPIDFNESSDVPSNINEDQEIITGNYNSDSEHFQIRRGAIEFEKMVLDADNDKISSEQPGSFDELDDDLSFTNMEFLWLCTNTTFFPSDCQCDKEMYINYGYSANLYAQAKTAEIGWRRRASAFVENYSAMFQFDYDQADVSLLSQANIVDQAYEMISAEKRVDINWQGILDIARVVFGVFDQIGVPNNGPTDLPQIGNDDGSDDGDNIPVATDVDDDNDGILDSQEGDGTRDTDNDGVPDSRDIDSDNDGVLDIIEANDANSDGIMDRQLTGNDSNGNGLDDVFDSANGGNAVALQDSDGDGLVDYLDADDDNDGTITRNESPGDRNPNTNDALDTDGDGTPDYLDSDTSTGNTNPDTSEENSQVIGTIIDGLETIINTPIIEEFGDEDLHVEEMAYNNRDTTILKPNVRKSLIMASVGYVSGLARRGQRSRAYGQIVSDYHISVTMRPLEDDPACCTEKLGFWRYGRLDAVDEVIPSPMPGVIPDISVAFGFPNSERELQESIEQEFNILSTGGWTFLDPNSATFDSVTADVDINTNTGIGVGSEIQCCERIFMEMNYNAFIGGPTSLCSTPQSYTLFQNADLNVVQWRGDAGLNLVEDGDSIIVNVIPENPFISRDLVVILEHPTTGCRVQDVITIETCYVGPGIVDGNIPEPGVLDRSIVSSEVNENTRSRGSMLSVCETSPFHIKTNYELVNWESSPNIILSNPVQETVDGAEYLGITASAVPGNNSVDGYIKVYLRPPGTNYSNTSSSNNDLITRTVNVNVGKPRVNFPQGEPSISVCQLTDPRSGRVGYFGEIDWSSIKQSILNHVDNVSTVKIGISPAISASDMFFSARPGLFGASPHRYVTLNYFERIDNEGFFMTPSETEVPYIVVTNPNIPLELQMRISNDCGGEIMTIPLNISGVCDTLGGPRSLNDANELDIEAAEESLKVSPNPSNGVFNASVSEPVNKVTLEVYNFSNKTIYSQNFEVFSNQRVDLGRPSPGIYIVKLIYNEGQSELTSKLIIK